MSDLKFRKLTPVRLFEQVVDQIKEMIMFGELKPGDKLPSEQELEKRLNVSRSSIREALRILEFEGYIEARKGSGSYVSQHANLKRGRIEVSKWLVQRGDMLNQLLQVREALEGMAASLTAALITRGELAMLEEIVDELAAVIARSYDSEEIDLDVLADLDGRFHLMISKLSGNQIAHELISMVLPSFHEGNKAVIYISNRLEDFLQDHRAVLEAIAAGDCKASEAAMRKHIARIRDDVNAARIKVGEE